MTSLPIAMPPGKSASAAATPEPRRRIIFLGLRGIPNVQGGVEKHVEMLAGEDSGGDDGA